MTKKLISKFAPQSPKYRRRTIVKEDLERDQAFIKHIIDCSVNSKELKMDFPAGQICTIVNGRYPNCKICKTGNSFQTVLSARKHCQSRTHKLAVQLYLAHKEIRRLKGFKSESTQPKQEEQIIQTTREPPKAERMPTRGSFITKTPSSMFINQPTPKPTQLIYNDQVFVLQNAQKTPVEPVIEPTITQQAPMQTEMPVHVEEEETKEPVEPLTERKMYADTPWPNIPEMKRFKKKMSSQEEFTEALDAYVKSVEPAAQYKRMTDTPYGHCFRALCEFMFLNPLMSLVTIQEKHLKAHVRSFDAYFTNFKNVIFSLNLDKQYFLKSFDFASDIKAWRTTREKCHVNWAPHLAKIWKAFYCAHPVTRVLFITMLATGCRIPLQEFRDAIQIDRNRRKYLLLRDGKVVRLDSVRKAFLPDTVCRLLREQVDRMGGKSDRAFLIGFACRANPTTKNRVTHHLRDIIKKMKYETPQLKKLMDDNNIHRNHDFRHTSFMMSCTYTQLNKIAIQQYYGWSSWGKSNAKNYVHDTTDDVVRQISDEIEKNFGWQRFEEPRSIYPELMRKAQRIDNYFKNIHDWGDAADLDRINHP